MKHTNVGNPNDHRNDVAFSVSIAAIVVSGVKAITVGVFALYKCCCDQNNQRSNDLNPNKIESTRF